MWIIIIVILVLVAVAIIKSSGDSPKKSNVEKDYWDEKIMHETLNRQKLHSRPVQRSSSIEPSIQTVNIEKYHSSNEIIGKIHGEYIRKYHESDGVVYSIDPEDADDYILRYVIIISNCILDIHKTLKDSSLEGLVAQCESQFQKWATIAEKKIRLQDASEEDIRRLQANRKYLSENKKRLQRLKAEGTPAQYQKLLSEMQNRYNEVLSSGNTFKETQLKELKELGLQIGNVYLPERKIPDIIFEVKGLYYRSAQAQLAAALLEVDDLLLLEAEPDNEMDASAVKVLTPSGECIGYVDSEHCVSVGAMINLIDSCTVIKKTRHQIPYITAKIKFKE